VLRRAPQWSEYTTASRTRGHPLRDGTQVTLAPGVACATRPTMGRHTATCISTAKRISGRTRRAASARAHTAGKRHRGSGDRVRGQVVWPYRNATEVVVTEGRVALWRADTTAASRAPRCSTGRLARTGARRPGPGRSMGAVSPRSNTASMSGATSRGPGVLAFRRARR